MRTSWTGRPPYPLIVADNGAVSHYGSRIRNTAVAPSLALVMDRVACLHNKGIGNKPWRVTTVRMTGPSKSMVCAMTMSMRRNEVLGVG